MLVYQPKRKFDIKDYHRDDPYQSIHDHFDYQSDLTIDSIEQTISKIDDPLLVLTVNNNIDDRKIIFKANHIVHQEISTIYDKTTLDVVVFHSDNILLVFHLLNLFSKEIKFNLTIIDPFMIDEIDEDSHWHFFKSYHLDLLLNSLDLDQVVIHQNIESFLEYQNGHDYDLIINTTNHLVETYNYQDDYVKLLINSLSIGGYAYQLRDTTGQLIFNDYKIDMTQHQSKCYDLLKFIQIIIDHSKLDYYKRLIKLEELIETSELKNEHQQIIHKWIDTVEHDFFNVDITDDCSEDWLFDYSEYVFGSIVVLTMIYQLV